MNVSVSAGYSTRTDLAAGDILAFLARKRRGIHQEVHGERRLVHAQKRQRIRMLEVAQGGTDADLVDAVQEDDVARFGLLDLHAREALEH